MESGEEGTPGVPRDQQSIPTFLHWAVRQVLVSGCHRPVDRSSLEGSSLSGPHVEGAGHHGEEGRATGSLRHPVIFHSQSGRREMHAGAPSLFLLCVFVFEHAYACPCAYRHSQKPEEGVCWGTCEHFQAVTNHLTWVLGTGLWSSIKSSKLSHLSRPCFLLLI